MPHSQTALHQVWWRASLSFSFVQEAERACLWENVLIHYTSDWASLFREDLTEFSWFMVTNIFPFLFFSSFMKYRMSPNYRLSQLDADLCRLNPSQPRTPRREIKSGDIQWGCWVWNKSGENSNRLTIICHSYFHSKCVQLLATKKGADNVWAWDISR